MKLKVNIQIIIILVITLILSAIIYSNIRLNIEFAPSELHIANNYVCFISKKLNN